MKMSIGAMAFVAVVVTPLVGAAQDAEVSANVGFTSEYFYRGIPQTPTSASAGLDVEFSKVYLGTWAADVGDGNEVDFYAGVGTDLGDLSVSLGGTGYFYTDDAFDSTYLEGNLNVGFKALSAEFSYGSHRADPDANPYWFLGFTVEEKGLYATFGMFGDDADGANFNGEYYEAGYALTVSELDLSVSWIFSTGDILSVADGDHALVFSVSHTFDLN